MRRGTKTFLLWLQAGLLLCPAFSQDESDSLLWPEPRVNVTDFVMPPPQYPDQMIMRYVDVQNPEREQYHFIRLHHDDGKHFMYVKVLDHEDDILLDIVCEGDSEKLKLHKFNAHVSDANGVSWVVDARILDTNYIDFEHSPDTAYGWSVEYKFQDDKIIYRCERKFFPRSEDQKYYEDKYPTVMYIDSFYKTLITGKTSVTDTFSRMSLYAKGLGLLRYIEKDSQGRVHEFMLVEVFDKKGWRLAKRKEMMYNE